MKKAFVLLASAAVLGTGLAAVPAAAQSQTTTAAAQQPGPRGAILKWHEVMLDTHARTTNGSAPAQMGGPLRTTRGFAMTQIAVFDAVNAFDGKYTSYNAIPAAQGGASIEVAIAYAAHDVLASVWTGQAARLAQVLADDLAAINANPAALAKGRAVGKAAAAAIIADRTNDGSQIGEVNFGGGGRHATGTTDYNGDPVNAGIVGTLKWRPDPETAANQIALGANWGAVKPFALQNGAQFRADPFPAPGSVAYRTTYNDVKAVGSSQDTAGSTSTPATEFIGNYWGYEGTPNLGVPPRLYAQIAVELAGKASFKNPADLARYFALVHISMADAGIAVWDTKYYYNTGRPVTVIREEDGDTETTADPAWKPFGISRANLPTYVRQTPPFPSYSSGHAAFGSSMFEAVRGFLPDNTAFTFVSEEYDGATIDPVDGGVRPLVPVRYNSLSEASTENARSRVFNGSHWQQDSTVGKLQGEQTAQYARATLFQKK
jgi:PAP2 superfamily